MKVSNKIPNAIQTSEAAKTAKSGSADSLGAKRTRAGSEMLNPADSSRVELSSRAQDMAKAKALATPTNDIDEAKVARLQMLIDSGQYKVDADAIAERMLDEQSKMPM